MRPSDVPKTVLHEVVGHKGLQAVFGKRFNEFLDGVYKEHQADIDALGNPTLYNRDPGTIEGKRLLTSEFLAHTAENDVKPSWWREFLQKIKMALRNIPGLQNLRFTDAEINAALARSYRAMKRVNARNTDYMQTRFKVSDDVHAELDRALTAEEKQSGWAYINGEPIARSEGNEIPEFDNKNDLKKWVRQYYQDRNETTVPTRYGFDINLSGNSINSSIGHGLTSAKSQAFLLVPDIIRNGQLLGKLEKNKDSDANAYVIGAPIEIGGEPYIGLIAFHVDDPNMNQMKLHEVVIQKKSDTVSGSIASAQESQSARRGVIRKLLDDLKSASTDTISRENGNVNPNSENDNHFSLSEQPAGLKAYTLDNAIPSKNGYAVESVNEQSGEQFNQAKGVIAEPNQLFESVDLNGEKFPDFVRRKIAEYEQAHGEINAALARSYRAMQKSNPKADAGQVRFQLNSENEQRAYDALRRIVEGSSEETVPNLRSDLAEYGGTNDVTFIYGDKGKGLEHIGDKRGVDVLLNVIDTVINGEIDKSVPAKKTVHLVNDGYEAVLSLDEHGKQKTWLLSGWRINTPDAPGEVSTQPGATQREPTFSRQALGAGLDNISHDNGNVNLESENDIRFSISEYSDADHADLVTMSRPAMQTEGGAVRMSLTPQAYTLDNAIPSKNGYAVESVNEQSGEQFNQAKGVIAEPNQLFESVDLNGEKFPGFVRRKIAEYEQAHGEIKGDYYVDALGGVVHVNDGSFHDISYHKGKDEKFNLIPYIPQMLRNAVFIQTENNGRSKSHLLASKVRYGDKRLIVSMVIHESDNKHYYDHNLTEIENAEHLDGPARKHALANQKNSASVNNVIQHALLSSGLNKNHANNLNFSISEYSDADHADLVTMIRPYVKTVIDKEPADWGQITAEMVANAPKDMKLEALPIRMLKGRHLNDHNGFGLHHIYEQHGAELESRGIDLTDYLSGIFSKISQVYASETSRGGIRLELVNSNKPRDVGVLELRKENGYYSVVTAFPQDIGNYRFNGKKIWQYSAPTESTGKQQTGSLVLLSADEVASTARMVRAKSNENISHDNGNIKPNFENNINFSISEYSDADHLDLVTMIRPLVGSEITLDKADYLAFYTKKGLPVYDERTAFRFAMEARDLNRSEARSRDNQRREKFLAKQYPLYADAVAFAKTTDFKIRPSYKYAGQEFKGNYMTKAENRKNIINSDQLAQFIADREYRIYEPGFWGLILCSIIFFVILMSPPGWIACRSSVPRGRKPPSNLT